MGGSSPFYRQKWDHDYFHKRKISDSGGALDVIMVPPKRDRSLKETDLPLCNERPVSFTVLPLLPSSNR